MEINKRRKSTEYLYGITPTKFKDKTYEEALKIKIEKGVELTKRLADRSSEVFNNREVIPDAADKYNELAVRLSDVIKALKFNEFLLNEYYTALKDEK